MLASFQLDCSQYLYDLSTSMTPAKGEIEHLSLNSTRLNANYLDKSSRELKAKTCSRQTETQKNEDTLLGLRSCDDSSSVCILYMPAQQLFQPQKM